jgi:hypothetical protein
MCVGLEEKTEFKFAELSERAKSKARDAFREGHLDYEWWDDIYKDVLNIGKLLGIYVGTRTGKYSNGNPWSQPDIYFAGFSCQGDGACFSGDIWLSQMKGASARITAETNDGDPRLVALAVQAETLYGRAATIWTALRLAGTDVEDLHDLSDARFDVKNDGRGYFTRATPHDDDTWQDDLTKDVQAFVTAFSVWIYRSLEAEHDYLNSDECIDAALEDYEKMFNEDGSMI